MNLYTKEWNGQEWVIYSPDGRLVCILRSFNKEDIELILTTLNNQLENQQ